LLTSILFKAGEERKEVTFRARVKGGKKKRRIGRGQG